MFTGAVGEKKALGEDMDYRSNDRLKARKIRALFTLAGSVQLGKPVIIGPIPGLLVNVKDFSRIYIYLNTSNLKVNLSNEEAICIRHGMTGDFLVRNKTFFGE
ncbi:hypothetical protein AVEN_211469-1 [Araneus ventricosus]|uniref:Uncharacterized protein n=1 Tax=Araneus ventricosus TaxID=182803 RepID=A0A4Y2V9J2_ARAVE|nr:hypothetical protein AVEN_211469-1 [Araneus ventricosus]